MFRLFAAGAVVLASAVAHAAVFSPITFSTSTDYTGNFTSGTNFSYDSTNQLLRYGATSGSAGTNTVRYTTSTDFLTETLSYDTSFSAFNSAPSSGIYARVQSDNTGILALVNAGDSSTSTTGSLQLRLFYGGSAATGGAGTVFATQTVTLPRTISTGSALHVTLTQTSAADPVFNLSVSDATGVLATTGDVTFSINDNYNTAGGIALRASSTYAGTVTTFDNLASTAVPEPATLGMLGLGGLTLLRRRRA